MSDGSHHLKSSRQTWSPYDLYIRTSTVGPLDSTVSRRIREEQRFETRECNRLKHNLTRQTGVPSFTVTVRYRSTPPSFVIPNTNWKKKKRSFFERLQSSLPDKTSCVSPDPKHESKSSPVSTRLDPTRPDGCPYDYSPCLLSGPPSPSPERIGEILKELTCIEWHHRKSLQSTSSLNGPPIHPSSEGRIDHTTPVTTIVSSVLRTKERLMTR